MQPAGMLLMGLAVAANAAAADPAVLQYKVSGDAIATPLAAPGDALRGRDIVAGRDGNCLLCHAIPETGARFMGDIAPPLSGIGARLSAAQLRLRVVDQSRLNPDTVMPSYFKVDGLHRVAPAFRGKPILNAAQVEDVVAFLQTLK
ncbi:MAG: sulfur oxidation c-type cytochrome SoxX [Betaproteobacteria bacterium]|nr:sulfur oxidation c-type cytochrome SoxX [Betaproteobacteria bacterium]